MIEVKLLKDNYKNNEDLHEAFLQDKISDNEEFVSGETIILNDAPEFPIYMGDSGDERSEKFLEAFETISEYYLNTDRDINLNEKFWHSLLCQNHREYLLENYPQIKNTDGRDFKNIVLKDFNFFLKGTNK